MTAITLFHRVLREHCTYTHLPYVGLIEITAFSSLCRTFGDSLLDATILVDLLIFRIDGNKRPFPVWKENRKICGGGRAF